MSDLIDTTEMYLKTIYELLEDGVTPMRARIVDRLGHSGPTVSQTIARMERDGLVKVASDRRLDLTPKGTEVATEVVRKHRLAERLLVDVIGLDWKLAHDEACRWEHVMSDAVEQRLCELLESVEKDPYGNPIPFTQMQASEGISLARLREEVSEDGQVLSGVVDRIGEPIQADAISMRAFADMELRPGQEVFVVFGKDYTEISYTLAESKDRFVATVPAELEPHFFVSFTK